MDKVVKINSDSFTFIDKDNNKVFNKGEILKLDISSKYDYTKLCMNCIFGGLELNDSAREIIKYFARRHNKPAKESVVTKYLSAYTDKSERTFSRGLSSLLIRGIVIKLDDEGYKLNTNVFDEEISEDTKILVIELNPEDNKITI